MAELADARDLKSREIHFSYRFDPGFRHHYIAEWSSLVARRAHNPKVMRFKSHLRNQKTKPTLVVGFIFCSRRGLPLAPFGLERDERARWVTSEKQLKTVFHDGSPQSKESAEPRLAQAIGDDYATGRGCVCT